MSYMAKATFKASSHDIVEALVKANVISDELGTDIIAKGHDVQLYVEARIDSEELVAEARADTLLGELEDRPGFMMPNDVDTSAVAEGISYVRSGQTVLAEAMFRRAMDGADLRPIEAALHS